MLGPLAERFKHPCFRGRFQNVIVGKIVRLWIPGLASQASDAAHQPLTSIVREAATR